MHDGLRRVLDPRWITNEEQEFFTSFCVNAGADMAFGSSFLLRSTRF